MKKYVLHQTKICVYNKATTNLEGVKKCSENADFSLKKLRPESLFFNILELRFLNNYSN